MAYRFVRSWVLPKFFDIMEPEQRDREELKTQLNELQNTTKFVMDTVSQTLETVAAQQEQTGKLLSLLASAPAKGGCHLECDPFQTRTCRACRPTSP